jgi:hypothetical protein
MAAVFWDGKGMLMAEFLRQQITIPSEVYFRTLKNCIGPFGTKDVEY